MKTKHFFNILCALFSFVVIFTPVISQQLNDTTTTTATTTNVPITAVSTETEVEVNQTDNVEKPSDIIIVKTETKPSAVSKLYMSVVNPIKSILEAPKVNSVMRNIATCVVNGAVELISYYFPAPLIPIIASAAGMMIPFEPVLMLRDKMPVTSYRRAFLTALNSFLGKFDRYKLQDNDEYDPYMTQRFNRRMMNYGINNKVWLPSEPTTPKDTTSEPKKAPKGSFLATIDKLFSTLDRLRRQDGDDDSIEDPGRRYNWKKRNGN